MGRLAASCQNAAGTGKRAQSRVSLARSGLVTPRTVAAARSTETLSQKVAGMSPSPDVPKQIGETSRSVRPRRTFGMSVPVVAPRPLAGGGSIGEVSNRRHRRAFFGRAGDRRARRAPRRRRGPARQVRWMGPQKK